MNMTVDKMNQIFDTEIPYNDLIIDKGIYIIHEDKTADISIGISYEHDDDGNEVYIFNLFLGRDEYINCDSVGNRADKDEIILELVNKWNKYISLDSINSENDNDKRPSILGELEAAKTVVAQSDKQSTDKVKKRETESL